MLCWLIHSSYIIYLLNISRFKIQYSKESGLLEKPYSFCNLHLKDFLYEKTLIATGSGQVLSNNIIFCWYRVGASVGQVQGNNEELSLSGITFVANIKKYCLVAVNNMLCSLWGGPSLLPSLYAILCWQPTTLPPSYSYRGRNDLL